jgi:predicted  nucleic acid-binding Zn-ribbon protein
VLTDGRAIKMRGIALAILLLLPLFSGCAPAEGFDSHLKPITSSYRFSVVRWEAKAIHYEILKLLYGQQGESENEVEMVTEYFGLTDQIRGLENELRAVEEGLVDKDPSQLRVELGRLQHLKNDLEKAVEGIIERQIREILSEQGIFNPMLDARFGFPPVNFSLEQPPHLLVVSPRERINTIRELTLERALSVEDMEDIESKVDELGVSSLVVELGGVATYPSLVANDSSLRHTLNTVAEEWLHQYLAFKPLGFLYLLDLAGISRDYEVATMNETLAGMVGKEIGTLVYERYYAANETGDNASQAPESGFDFNKEMREIRRTVDAYLADGEVELAEEFMEKKRQFLASIGYHIRKLNQAYFAFHGAYADRPTSISPIGAELRQLRAESASLEEFLDTVARMSGREDLTETFTHANEVEEPTGQ